MEKREHSTALPWECENDGDPLVSVLHPRVHQWVPLGIAIILSLVFHTAAVVLVPDTLFAADGGDAPVSKIQNRAFQLKILPPEPPPPQPDRFVEVNRHVVQNKPDETSNFAAKDQQASQIEKSKTIGPDPAVDGEEPDSSRLISGKVLQSAPSDPSGGERRGSSQQSQESPQLQPTLSPPVAPRLQSDKLMENEGLASWTEVADAKEFPEKEPQKERVVPLSMDQVVSAVQEASHVMPEGTPTVGMDAPQPRPRPRLSIDATRGPLRKSSTGLANTSGQVAWDANFSEFGDYVQRMFDAVQLKWDELNNYGQNSINEVRTHVRIEFYITKTGHVEDLKVLQTNANQAAVWRCVDAIEGNAPYFPWTPDMVQLLGDRQPIRVTFRYR